MNLTKRILAATGFMLSIGLTGCYTVLLTPNAEEPRPRRDISSSDSLLEPVGEESDSFSDETRDAGDDQDDVTVNRFYIYDSWPGNWYYDPFWDSPFAWSYSTWWWGSMYNPWWTPWPYSGYGYGWGRTYFPFYSGYRSWDWPGYYDPYWMYADHFHHWDGDPNQRRPFNRRELVHTRDGAFAGLTGGVPGRSGTAGLGKTESHASAPETYGTRRIRRSTDSGVSRPSSGAASESRSRRVRRQDNDASGGGGSVQRTGRGSSGGGKSGGGSSGSGRHQRRESSGSESSAPAYNPPSSSGSSGSSGSLGARTVPAVPEVPGAAEVPAVRAGRVLLPDPAADDRPGTDREPTVHNGHCGRIP